MQGVCKSKERRRKQWTESVRCLTMEGLLRRENHPMSHVEYGSRSMPVFAKLAGMLRNIPALRSMFARFAKLLHGNKEGGEPLVSEFLEEAPSATENAGQPFADIEVSGESTIPIESGLSERENLIRRRWVETGIKMWNPRFHGAGQAALNIQGRADLLPMRPGETRREYDRLEFKLIAGQIICEGVVVDPPKPRR